MEANATAAPELQAAPQQRLLLLGLLVGVLVVGIDSTIVASILPRIVGEFHDLALAPWVFAIYMLLQIASAPLLGKLSDRVGRKRIFLVGLVVFMLGSELIAFSHSFAQLIVFRALQGVGAGAILPSALATLFLDFPREQRAKLQGAFAAMYGISNVLGPVLGFAIAESVGWRFAFHVNILFVSTSSYLVVRNLSDRVARNGDGGLDILGAVTLVATVMLVSLAAMQFGGADSLPPLPVGPLVLAALGAVCGALFFYIERRAADPIVPAYFVRDKLQVLIGNMTTGAVMYGFIFFLPLFMRAAFNASPGRALLPLTVSLVFGSMSMGRLIAKFGIRTPAVAAALLMVTGAALSTRIGVSATSLVIALSAPIVGLGVGGMLVAMVVAMQEGTPPEYMGVSSSLSQFMRNLGGLLSVNLLSALQSDILERGLTGRGWSTLSTKTTLKDLAEQLFSASNNAGASAQMRRLVVAAYTHASATVFTCLAGLALVVLAVAIRMPRHQSTREEAA